MEKLLPKNMRAKVMRAKGSVLKGLAALHEPDMVSGGYSKHEPTRTGSSNVNSSIGASWNQEGPEGTEKSRLQTMENEARAAKARGDSSKQMNVKLKICN